MRLLVSLFLAFGLIAGAIAQAAKLSLTEGDCIAKDFVFRSG